MKKSELRQIIKEEIQKLNENKLSTLKVGDKFKLAEDGKIQRDAFMYTIKLADAKDVVFTVTKINPTTIQATGDVPDKYKMKGFINFKMNDTGHWRSAGKDITITKV